MRAIRSGLILGLLLGCSPRLWADPPPPAEYRVQLRYRILAGRNDRLRQYFDLIRYLESIGFRKDPGAVTEPEDPLHDRMTGTIAGPNARLLLREPHIKSLLLVPVGHALPEQAGATVKVQMELVGGLPLDRQRVLADQVRERLRLLGFQERVGYDHRGFTRLVGTIPVKVLDLLVRDLRYQPGGWFLLRQPVAQLPLPLRNLSPVLVTEVLPEPEGVPAVREAPPAPAADNAKLSADLRTWLSREGVAEAPVRVEVLLVRPPGDDDSSWQQELTAAAPGLRLEGRLGSIVTASLPGKEVSALLTVPWVDSVRLPRSGALPAARAPVLDATALGKLRSAALRGRGVVVAVIDADFRGAPSQIGRQLPADTRLIDLTGERNPGLEPDPYPDDATEEGTGTRLARAVVQAAAGARLVLVRVDPASPYQVLSVARAIAGEPVGGVGLRQRQEELIAEGQSLKQRQTELRLQRNVILNTFGQDEAAQQKREAYRQEQERFDRDERAYRERLHRYLSLRHDLEGLRGAAAVVCGLVWNDGYPVGGSGPLSRYLDDQLGLLTTWIQASGPDPGQVWLGYFRDDDGNGVMEFAPATTPLPPGRWTRELNFLAWKPNDGPVSSLVPGGTTLRVAVQWREAHDSSLWNPPTDPYPKPLADLRLMVLRQRDPKGESLPRDDLEVVAVSSTRPQRILNAPNAATYAQSLEFTVDQPGVYMVRLEGRPPTSTRPESVSPVGNVSAPVGELWPRLVVEAVDAASRAVGRPIFLDFATTGTGWGMPADARGVVRFGDGAVGPAAAPAGDR
ncbi:MAG: hypothetical protein NZ700_03510 [Gemmataceae bacterium]|nr:hypothetical protein [Gemmataceae bacterium]MDW8263985.1 hypothetical protein [Gemmataceae bacterium]